MENEESGGGAPRAESPPGMLYRRFGRTGLAIPVLSAGFMRAMHSWQDLPLTAIPRTSAGRMAAVVERALTLGINHFETARGYGTSERELGVVLASIPRERFILQTKVQPTPDPADFTAQVLDSLSRLQVEFLDLLTIHGLNDHRALWQACRSGGCLAAARRLQAAGRVGHVGFSSHGGIAVHLDAVRHEGDGGFDYMNLHWYYIYQIHSPAIDEAAARDMGVFIISPTDKGGMLQKPPDKFVELCRPLSPILFNDLFCLSRPGVATISVGASGPADFAEHLKAISLLSDAGRLVAERDGRLRSAMQRATGGERPDNDWGVFPSWDETPGYINIPFILWLARLARGWGLVDYGRRRYRLLGQDLPWVPGNDAASVGRFDLTKVLRRRGIEPVSVQEELRAAHELLAAERPGGG